MCRVFAVRKENGKEYHSELHDMLALVNCDCSLTSTIRNKIIELFEKPRDMSNDTIVVWEQGSTGVALLLRHRWNLNGKDNYELKGVAATKCGDVVEISEPLKGVVSLMEGSAVFIRSSLFPYTKEDYEAAGFRFAYNDGESDVYCFQ